MAGSGAAFEGGLVGAGGGLGVSASKMMMLYDVRTVIDHMMI